DRIGRENQWLASDPAGEERAERGKRKPDDDADAQHSGIDVPGARVTAAREQRRRDGRRERRRDRDERRDAEGVQERSRDGRPALPERAGEEADAGADQQRSEQNLQVHDFIERQPAAIEQASVDYQYHRISL